MIDTMVTGIIVWCRGGGRGSRLASKLDFWGIIEQGKQEKDSKQSIAAMESSNRKRKYTLLYQKMLRDSIGRLAGLVFYSWERGMLFQQRTASNHPFLLLLSFRGPSKGRQTGDTRMGEDGGRILCSLSCRFPPRVSERRRLIGGNYATCLHPIFTLRGEGV